MKDAAAVIFMSVIIWTVKMRKKAEPHLPLVQRGMQTVRND